MGYICAQNAFSRGPAGPVAAIYGMANYTFVVIECIKNKKMLNLAETIGVLLTIYGSTLIVIPEVLEKYCFCCCFKNKKQNKNL